MHCCHLEICFYVFALCSTHVNRTVPRLKIMSNSSIMILSPDLTTCETKNYLSLLISSKCMSYKYNLLCHQLEIFSIMLHTVKCICWISTNRVASSGSERKNTRIKKCTTLSKQLKYPSK